jgi:hypothetical protein
VLCHHRAIQSADAWPDYVPVPTFGPRMVCTRCGIIGADAGPNWKEQPPSESLTGAAFECRAAEDQRRAAGDRRLIVFRASRPRACRWISLSVAAEL